MEIFFRDAFATNQTTLTLALVQSQAWQTHHQGADYYVRTFESPAPWK